MLRMFGVAWLMLSVAACQQATFAGSNGFSGMTASSVIAQHKENVQMDTEGDLADWASYVSYSSIAQPNGQRCNTGILIDEDGMQQRPAVEMLDRSGAVLWRSAIALPTDFYQPRATHCAGSGPDVFVLVQADTQSTQSLSQTMLEVVTLKSASGKIVSSQPVAVPDVRDAYSAWVEKDVSNFVLVADGSLRVSGHYRLMAAPEHFFSFVARIDLDVSI